MDEAGNQVIQVDGIKGVRVPIGLPDVMQNIVAAKADSKASEIIADVDTMKVVSDPHPLPPPLFLPKYSFGLSEPQCSYQSYGLWSLQYAPN